MTPEKEARLTSQIAFAATLGRNGDADTIYDVMLEALAERDAEIVAKVNRLQRESLLNDELDDMLAKCHVEIARLREALERYGCHEMGCPGGFGRTDCECTCGFSAAMKGESK